ncbi:hypothetical protein PENTCL1PPCAC_8133, partial [Pristionchus entomophagus]
YVGNLDPSVTAEVIYSLFEMIGVIKRHRLFFHEKYAEFAFVEYFDEIIAHTALKALNGRRLVNKPMMINFATNTGNFKSIDISSHSRVFVGDLSSEVNEGILKKRFDTYGLISHVQIVRDPSSFKSKGYGYITFFDRLGAERSIELMKDETLGKWPIRTEWARSSNHEANESGDGSRREMNYEDVYKQTTNDNTS